MAKRGGSPRSTRSPPATRSSPPVPKKAAVPDKIQQKRSQSPQPQTTVVIMQPQQKQPGLFGQAAATAGGVAVGSAVGHTVGHVITGGLNKEAQPQQAEQSSQQDDGPCALQISQFLQCTQNNDDIAQCTGFNEAIRKCKNANHK